MCVLANQRNSRVRIVARFFFFSQGQRTKRVNTRLYTRRDSAREFVKKVN